MAEVRVAHRRVFHRQIDDISVMVVRHLRKLRRRGRAQASQRRIPQSLRPALRFTLRVPAFLDQDP